MIFVLWLYLIGIALYTLGALIVTLEGLRRFQKIKKEYPLAHLKKVDTLNKAKVFVLAIVPFAHYFFGICYLFAATNNEFMEEVMAESVVLN